jgi:hypothetical protein
VVKFVDKRQKPQTAEDWSTLMEEYNRVNKPFEYETVEGFRDEYEHKAISYGVRKGGDRGKR